MSITIYLQAIRHGTGSCLVLAWSSDLLLLPLVDRDYTDRPLARPKILNDVLCL